MTRTRIAVSMRWFLLALGVPTRITTHPGVLPWKADPVPMAIGMAEGPAEIVDPETGNICKSQS